MARVFHRFTPRPGANKKDRGPKETKQQTATNPKTEKSKSTEEGGK